MSEVGDVDHAIRKAVQELISRDYLDLKSDLHGFRDDVNERFGSFEFQVDSQGKAILAAIEK